MVCLISRRRDSLRPSSPSVEMPERLSDAAIDAPIPPAPPPVIRADFPSVESCEREGDTEA
jgi:hypothetical protein